MIANDFFYFCSECKKQVKSVSELFFVEENSSRGFCSEECIEDFYIPFIKFYDQKIKELMKRFNRENLDKYESLSLLEDKKLVELISSRPDEIWENTTDLNEKIYYYIKRMSDHIIIMVCTHFQSSPSFIFCLAKFSNFELIEEFQTGKKWQGQKRSESGEEDFPQREIMSEINEEGLQFLEMLDNKKSQLLGDLLSKMRETDIPIENFSDFEFAYEETLSNPDEVYEFKDREGDLLFTYLKSFIDNEHGSFFYVVVALKYQSKEEDFQVYPILTFPTNDIDLFATFRKGQCQSCIIKN